MVHDTPLRRFEPHLDTSKFLPYKPNPEKSLALPKDRQRVVDAVIALYSSKASEEATLHYHKESVYDDLLSFCDTRRKIAGQFYALPKVFSNTQVLEYEVAQLDPIVLKLRTAFTEKPLGTKEVEHLVTLVTENDESGRPLIRYHKDQWNEKDFSHDKSIGSLFKKVNGDGVAKILSLPESL